LEIARCEQRRGLAKVNGNEKELGLAQDAWFNGTGPSAFPVEGPGSGLDHRPPDERTLKLGKTIRLLHDRIPTLLTNPLPQEILSPQITLQLFPSTHPHLPTVTGRLAYTAALWTSPVAWGRVPVLGNVKLIVLSERMVKNGGSSSGSTFSRTDPETSKRSRSSGGEKLIVRWKTCPRAKGNGGIDKLSEWLSTGTGDKRSAADRNKEFHGLFLFEFDEEGRVLRHVIEHAEEGNEWERETSKVISVTDWLLGRAWGKREEEAGLALGCRVRR